MGLRKARRWCAGARGEQAGAVLRSRSGVTFVCLVARWLVSKPGPYPVKIP